MLGAWGEKNAGEENEEQLLVFFVNNEESLISWKNTDTFVIDEGAVTEIDFGVAVQEYRDTNFDCQPLVTTAAAVTQYLAGKTVEEY